MPYYSEPLTFILRPNGTSRLDSSLASLAEELGGVGVGFDDDGRAPAKHVGLANRRQQAAGRRRLWWFPEPLPLPWPSGVAVVPDPAYARIEATREATKPVPVITPEPDPALAEFTPEERQALRALLP